MDEGCALLGSECGPERTEANLIRASVSWLALKAQAKSPFPSDSSDLVVAKLPNLAQVAQEQKQAGRS